MSAESNERSWQQDDVADSYAEDDGLAWPSMFHDGCNYAAMRPLDNSGLFCTKCGWSWSATAARLNIALAELSALKARRCDGCAHYGQPVVLHANVPAYGACSLPSTESAEMEIAGGLHAETEIELLVDADFACAAWTEKP